MRKEYLFIFVIGKYRKKKNKEINNKENNNCT